MAVDAEVGRGVGEHLPRRSGAQHPKRLVFGRFERGRWRTEEIVTCKIAKGRRRLRRCHECGKIIIPPAAYYSDRIYYHRREYAGLAGWISSTRKHYHVLCYGCWRGERLDPRGSTVKFIDRSKPPGKRVVGVRPFSSLHRRGRFSSSLRRKCPARDNTVVSTCGESTVEPTRPSAAR
ncbi:MAG: hypothetical protein JRD89_11450 [Deltaproteobacteria bacterium]|nr:hypothetical protein [Deltaproteobacteria bacterium]